MIEDNVEKKVIELASRILLLCVDSGLSKEQINAATLIADQLRFVVWSDNNEQG